MRPEIASAVISLRDAGPADQEFLIKLYASTRQDEIASWGWNSAQQEAFLRMQFLARERSYAAAFPAAEHHIVLAGDSPAGAMIVARSAAEIRLVDISLLPEFRNRGFGTALVNGLIAEADRARLPLRLSVRRDNRAADLYKRLGFDKTSEDEMYVQLERKPA